MVDYKTLFAAVIGAFVLTFSFSVLVDGDNGTGFDFNFDSLFDNPMGFSLVQKISGFSESKTVSFSAELEPYKVQDFVIIAKEPISMIELNFSMPNMPFLVNGIFVASDNNLVVIVNFTGTIHVTDKVSINGKALMIKVNDNTMSHKNLLSLEANNLTIVYMGLDNIPVNDVHMESVFGEINVTDKSDKITYQLSKESVIDIMSFKGDFIMRDKSSFTFLGDGIIKSTLLKTPA
ncbi:MAG: hypothetical protein K0B02_02210 [DPANN group archaeon]|nr:hypothetical protein [DPANN group archaeon]